MEQYRTRQDRSGPRRGKPPLPPQAGSGDPGDRQARPGAARSAPRQGRPAAAGPRPAQDGARPPRQAQGEGRLREGSRPSRGGSRPASAGRDGSAGDPRNRPARTRRPTARAAAGLRRLPNPRLTGLGGGLFCSAVMLLLALLDALLFGSSLTVYGVLFLPVCLLTAAWVRRGDLVTGPVVVPIAFTVGLLPIAGGEGVGGRLMNLFTALATEAGWLYGGTLVAGLVVITRRLRLVQRRRAAARPRPSAGA
ncbi:DUF6542 domain-containing protein [Streptomyces sp. NPDC058739]|uniref:DUF6542 domain-containing protein n=1 Tax=Streptomyces sp. NPDC058739 TaxID=3346618 RepID=UPI0036CE716E